MAENSAVSRTEWEVVIGFSFNNIAAISAMKTIMGKRVVNVVEAKPSIYLFESSTQSSEFRSPRNL